MLSNTHKWQDALPTVVLSNSLSNTRFEHQESKGRCAMARMDFDYLPRGNPCAQCRRPIAAPEWIEAGPRRTSYLWQCRACGYRFEALAYFHDKRPDQEALAA
jgi:hypothetical protein